MVQVHAFSGYTFELELYTELLNIDIQHFQEA